MPCLVVILALAFPRIVLVLLWLFTNHIGRAYDSFLIPLLGFIFLPLTTLTYAWLVNSGRPVGGVYLLLLILAVLIDAGTFGGARRRKSD